MKQSTGISFVCHAKGLRIATTVGKAGLFHASLDILLLKRVSASSYMIPVSP